MRITRLLRGRRRWWLGVLAVVIVARAALDWTAAIVAGAAMAVTALLYMCWQAVRTRTRTRDSLREYRGRLALGAILVAGVLPGTALALWLNDLLSGVAELDSLAAYIAVAAGVLVVVTVAAAATVCWRVLATPGPTALPDVAAAGVRAIAEIGEPDEIAQRTLPLLWERSSWIIRRVEHIHFVDRTMVRRKVSVDFRVPASLLEFAFAPDQLEEEELELMAAGRPREGGEHDATRYVPVSVLRGWPPVLNLDLRSADGSPLPLLSKATTNALDGRLLIALARHAFAEYADDFTDKLLVLVHEDGVLAQSALVVVTAAVEAVLDAEPGVDEERVDRFLNLARLLVHSTLLWVPVTEPEGTRQIVKLAYDEPVRRRLSFVAGLLTGFGLRGHVIGFEVGQVGDAGSYHLEIELPFPLETTGAELVIASRYRSLDRWERLLRRVRTPYVRSRETLRSFIARLEAIAARRLRRNPPNVAAVDRTNYQQRFTRRLHFYTSGQKSRPAMAWVRVAPERRGVPLAGAMTGLLVAVVVTGFNAVSDDVYAQRSAGAAVGSTVAFLLLAPSLLSYVLTRPADHAYATRMLSGVRLLTVASVLLATGCAATLIAAVVTGDEAKLDDVVPWLMRGSWVLAFALTLGLILPLRRRRQRLD